MAVTLKGTSVTYTVGTPSGITVNESNIDRYFHTDYKPTVTRNKTGSASTRYIFYELSDSAYSIGYDIAIYKAVFTARGKTAKVTPVASAATRRGAIANAKLDDNVTRLHVFIATSVSGDNFDDAEVSCPITIDLSPTITMTTSKEQTSPDPSTFGYLKGICTGSVSISVKTTWAYTGGSVYIPVSSRSISGNGKSTTEASLSLGTLNATSISVTASAKNSLGKTATASATIICTDYAPPEITSESVIRSAENEKNAVLTVKYKLDAANQRGTTGAISLTYTIKNGSITVISRTVSICASGSSLSSLTGTIVENITGSLLNEDINYTLEVYLTDRAKSEASERDIITSTFRLVHFNSSGKGIGIGGAAPANGIVIYLPAYIHDEGSLYDAVVAKGYGSSNDIDLRDLLLKILAAL